MSTLTEAQTAFFEFFDELAEVFLERETLLVQIQLALLCKEHVLITGPPGTAKSALASAVLGRLVDARTGNPSLFARQISELTVETDLLGPVDFKVLTETGRTEHLVEEGMLGASHAFLDEIFDGRDMLLRSILNVLHERELKHGRKITAGRTECAIMTTHRYLSEVLARAPELLLAFADRLSFICFVPKGFARPHSRAAMLERAAHPQRLLPRRQLTVQQLHLLQAQVAQVAVPAPMMEALERLTLQLERAVHKHALRMPEHVPTRYFSNRSLVKALWTLKAAVVRDVVFGDPHRALVVGPSDLQALRHCLVLGGPVPGDVEPLLAAAVDPRERAQLEILRVEHGLFDDALGGVLEQLSGGVRREAQVLGAEDDLAQAQALGRRFGGRQALQLVGALRQKLRPGPRHADNRLALLAAARTLLAAVDAQLTWGEDRPQERGEGGGLVEACTAALTLAAEVPELASLHSGLLDSAGAFASAELERLVLGAEGLEYGEGAMDELAPAARGLQAQLAGLHDLHRCIGVARPQAREAQARLEAQVRQRMAAALHRRARVLHRLPPEGADLHPLLVARAASLAEQEQALVQLDPAQRGLKQALLTPLAQRYLREALCQLQFEKLAELSGAVVALRERLGGEGLQAEPLLAQCAELLVERIRSHVEKLARKVGAERPGAADAFSGEAYARYRRAFLEEGADGEYPALVALQGALGPQAAQAAALGEAVAEVELTQVRRRVEYLAGWFSTLLGQLPAPHQGSRGALDRAFDRLVESRFPLLVLREAELERVLRQLRPLSLHPAALGHCAQQLERSVQTLAADFGQYSQRLLEARAGI
jgi:MoxR-like ATPase